MSLPPLPTFLLFPYPVSYRVGDQAVKRGLAGIINSL